jgi:peptide-methionine (R)-S-oxide reductase
VYANNNQRSRTNGYPIQKSEEEWKEVLSPMQYYILREGGTERPGYSILEKEKRSGTFKCAGCGTPLFQATDKFNSRTGWPSFARGLNGVEVEQINPLLQLTGAGAELRCRTCGGHLGDVFNDGYLFIGTEAALTGQRYCIDGAALVFYPDDNSKNTSKESSMASSELVRGDIPAVKSPQSLSSLFDPPVIQPRD